MKRLLPLILMFSGCVGLSSAGGLVKYVNGDASRFARCERLGENLHVTVNGGWAGRVALCDETRNAARNMAAAREATHMNILRIDPGGWSCTMIVEAFKCAADVGGMAE